MQTIWQCWRSAAALLLAAACGSGDGGAPLAPPPPPPPPPPPAPGLVRTRLDVPYGLQSTAQRLDLHLPPSGNGPFPVVVFVHGGGWWQGDKTLTGWNGPIPWSLVTERFAVASINYRLSGEAVFPAQIHDVKGAIRFLRLQAAEWALDSARFAIWGTSAGAHLAALLGTSGGEGSFEGPLHPGPSSRVAGVVDWFGPIDFMQLDTQLIQRCGVGVILNWSPGSNIDRLLGGLSGERAAQANPITYVSADDPPFFIQHGTVDCTVPMAQSVQLSDALVAGGLTDVTLDSLAGAGHGVSDAVFRSAANIEKVVAFLARVLH